MADIAGQSHGTVAGPGGGGAQAGPVMAERPSLPTETQRQKRNFRSKPTNRGKDKGTAKGSVGRVPTYGSVGRVPPGENWEVVLLVKKSGMLAGERRIVVDQNKNEWKLDNRKRIRKNQEGTSWRWNRGTATGGGKSGNKPSFLVTRTLLFSNSRPPF